MRPGDTIGGYALEHELGRGANATVWRARGDDGALVAVKILRARRPASEAYARFRDEVAALGRLAGHPGILPLIDAKLPERPTADDPAWLVMPEATTAREALEGAAIEEVVAAGAQFAETLADLAAHGISHRDIKPENLFLHDGRWLLGDFGLVEFPDKDPITLPNKRLGPAHFVAPDMITDPVGAAGQPADVYSLAKTLWVLLAGQRWPPLGEHRLDRDEYRLTTYVADARISLLEPIIARATRYAAVQRQDAAAFARQLRAWLTPTREAGLVPSLAEIADEIVAYDSQRLESQRAFAEIVPKLNNVVYRLKAISLDRVNAELGQAIPASGTYADAPSILVERGLLGPVGHHLSFTVVRMADVDRANLGALVFCASIAGGLDTDDRGHVAAAYLIMDNRLQETVWSSTEEFEVGSADEEHALQALATGLAQNLASAVHRFAEILRTRVQHAD